ncbi:MAG: hypothetical protein HRU19_24930 [Pseudobacteriovorax sp.]|nr:hypothetical protein [Pseudobacteriovorax sp.]
MIAFYKVILIAGLATLISCNNKSENSGEVQTADAETEEEGPATGQPSTGGAPVDNEVERADEDKTFIHYCEEADLEGELAKTVQYIKDQIGEDLCGLTAGRLSRITDFSFQVTGVVDIRPLRHHKTMETLDLFSQRVTDFTVLATMPRLASVNVSRNPITDLTAFANLERLETLIATDIAGVTSLSTLAGANSLTELNVSQTGITNLTGLEGFTSLQTLDISNTDVADVSALSAITMITTFNAAGTALALDPASANETNCPTTASSVVVATFCQNLINSAAADD